MFNPQLTVFVSVVDCGSFTKAAESLFISPTAVMKQINSLEKHLEISDLYGETLMIVAEGDSGVNDFIRNDLNRNHPAIQIEDTPHFYDISVFNRCADTNNVLLTLECWKRYIQPSSQFQ